MPWMDWQFWMVTILAILGVWMVARPLMPFRKTSGEDVGCPSCASGSAASKPKRRRVALTLERKKL